MRTFDPARATWEIKLCERLAGLRLVPDGETNDKQRMNSATMPRFRNLNPLPAARRSNRRLPLWDRIFLSVLRIRPVALLAALAVMFGCSQIDAQDPFGDPVNPFGGQGQALERGLTQATAAAEQSSEDRLRFDDPSRAIVIHSVASSNPQTADQLVLAINTLLHVNADAEVKPYLEKLSSLGADDAQLFMLHRSAGSPFFIDLASRAALQPEGRQYADKVLDAAWRYAYDPSRLDGLTHRLNHENVYVRSEAFEQLKQAGESGAAAIINALADNSRSSQFPYLRTALAKLGGNATPPLVGAMLSDDAGLQTEMAQALGFTPSRDAELVLYHALVTGTTSQIRRLAGQSLLRHLGSPPLQADVEANLFHAARDFGAPSPIDPYEPETFTTVWKWQEGLMPHRVRSDLAKQMLATRLAEALLFVRPDEMTYKRLYLVCALQAMKTEGGVDQPLDDAFADSLLRRFSVTDLNEALDSAMQRGLTAAATATCELMQRLGDVSVLDGHEGRPSPLVRALHYGDQRVTFAACNAISVLGVGRPFAGTSHFLSALVYLARSQGHRKVLIGHRDPAVVRNLADAAMTAGYTPITAINAQTLFSVAIGDPDIELIIISDTINQPDYLELVQMLRRDWRTRLIPIGLSHLRLDEPRITSFCREDRLVMAFPTTTEPAIVAQQLYHLSLRGGLGRLEAVTRAFYSRWASEQLSILTERETASVVYDFVDHQEQIAEGLYDPSTSLASAKVMARIGTPFAQRQLLNIANQNGLPLEIRQAATSSLAVAFRDNGILLTKDEILAQYAAYNSSAHESDESRQVLATILDLIEKK